jgi:hypothetical protein
LPQVTNSPWFHSQNNIWGGVLHNKATHYTFSSMLVCHFIPLRPKYLPQHPILKYPWRVFHTQCDRPSFTYI